MIIPIRCFTSGRLIASEYEKFKKRVEKGEDPEKVLDDLGIERYCCRRMLLTQVDLLDEIAPYC